MHDARRWAGRCFDLTYALLLFLITGQGFASWYSRITFSRSWFHAQYHSSAVYGYRIVGRDLVEFVHDHFFAHTTLPFHNPGAMYAPLFVVNGISFLIFAVLWGELTLRQGMVGPARLLVNGFMVTFVALTFFVVTPYDALSYAVFVAFALAMLTRGKAAMWLALPIGVLGVLTRESMLLALPMVLAVAAGPRRRDRRFAWVAASAGVAMAGAYLIPRFASGDGRLADRMLLWWNLHQAESYLGLVLVVLVSAIWVALCRVVDLRIPRDQAWVLGVFYLGSLPYVLVSAFYGVWLETRLIAPLLLADAVIRLVLLRERAGVVDSEVVTA